MKIFYFIFLFYSLLMFLPDLSHPIIQRFFNISSFFGGVSLKDVVLAFNILLFILVKILVQRKILMISFNNFFIAMNFLFFIFILITSISLGTFEVALSNVFVYIRNILIFFLIYYGLKNIDTKDFLIKVHSFVIVYLVLSYSLYIFFYLQLDLIEANILPQMPGMLYFYFEGVMRMSGFNYDPNFFCMTLTLFFIFIYHLYSLCPRKKYLVTLFFISLAIILSFSRSGILVLTMLLMIIFYFHRKEIKITLNKILLGVVSINLIVLVLLITYESLLGKIVERFLRPSEVGFQRSSLWNVALSGYEQSPYIGMGSNYVLSKTTKVAHNDFLEFLSSYGILGLVIYICILFSLVLLAYKMIYLKTIRINKIIFWFFSFSIFFYSFFFSVFGNDFFWYFVFLILIHFYNFKKLNRSLYVKKN